MPISSGFLTPVVIVSIKFDMISDVLGEPFSVSTPVGDSVVTERVYRGCPISLSTKVTLFYLVEHDILNFEVILGMYWLHFCFDFVDCKIQIVKFQFCNEPILKWKGET